VGTNQIIIAVVVVKAADDFVPDGGGAPQKY